MKKYLVLKTNHGFQGRLWAKDAVVEFDDDVTPNKHFQLLDGKAQAKKAEEAVVEEKMALSQLQAKVVKPLPTAGTILKGQKKAGVMKLKDSKEDF